MARLDRDVKGNDQEEPTVILLFVMRCRAWVDSHPRTGWYIAGVSTLNVVLNLLNLFLH